MNAVFESSNGAKYVFGVDGNTVFDMEVSSGVSVNLGKSQGFSQIGETVEEQTVSGRHIPVKGVIYKSVEALKNKMRVAFAPFAHGRLVVDDKYYIYVFVEDTPTFSTRKNDGRFSMRLFAPYPFFRTTSEKTFEIGNVIPAFSFPVNYSEPHTFGIKTNAKYVNVYNSGDVKTPFGIYITAKDECEIPKITNMETGEYLKLNLTMNQGDSLAVYRDAQGVLRAELTTEDDVQDVISCIDEGSTLFEVSVGDNLISANADVGEEYLMTRFSYHPSVVSVYES